MPEVPRPASTTSSPPSRPRLWRWFVVWFLIIFLGLAVAFPVYFYDGNSVRRTVLAHYYVLEIQLALAETGNLGPTSQNEAAALMAAALHVLVAVGAGALAAGFGWAYHKVFRSRGNTPKEQP